MDGDMNNYGNNNNNNTNLSPLWAGNSITNISMEPLVDQFGNLRFNNQIIPLTTNITPFISPSPSLPNLTTPTSPIANNMSPNLSLPSPFLDQSGQFFVVRMKQSPPVSTPQSRGNIYQTTVVQSSPNTDEYNQSSDGHYFGNVQTHKNYRNGNDSPDRFINNGAHARQRYSSTDNDKYSVYSKRRVSDPDRASVPFRGQPYMKKLSIDSSNGDVTMSSPEIQETEVSSGAMLQDLSSKGATKLVYVTNGCLHDGTDTSSMSSLSVSPYSSMPPSPRPEPVVAVVSPTSESKIVYDPVEPRYVKPSDNSRCLMCDKVVYAMEKRGPIKEVLFHKVCFKCAVCGMSLTFKNFSQNDNDLADLNVYCQSHKPSEKHGQLDAGALSINRALTAPRLGQVNDQIRGRPEAMKGGKLDTDSFSIKSVMNPSKTPLMSGDNVRNTRHSYNMDKSM